MPEAAPAADRRDSWLFWATFLLCYACALVPIWLPRLLPLCDLSTHLAAIGIWKNIDDPSWGYGQFYTLRTLPVPYWGHYFPTRVLAAAFSIETANKIYLSVYAFLLPASVALLARRFGRSPAVALLCWPLVFNNTFGWGFVSFCAGLPAALLALAYLCSLLAQSRIAARSALGLLTASVLVYFTHILSWVLFAAGAVGLIGWRLLSASSPRPLAQVKVVAATIALSAAGIFANYYYYSHSLPADSPVFKPGLRVVGLWNSPWHALGQFPKLLAITLPGSPALYLTVGALLLSWTALMLTAPRAPSRRLQAPGVLFLVALLLYLALPYRLYRPIDWFYISLRFAAPVALFAALLIRGEIAGRRRWLLAPAVLASLAYPLALAARFVEFNVHEHPFWTVLQHIPRGAATLTLLTGDMSDPAIDPQYVPYAGFYSYVQLFRGGYNPYALKTGFPYREIPGRALPAPPWSGAVPFSQLEHGQYYDYVLTRNEHWTGEFLNMSPTKAPLVVQAAEWRLYATRGLRPLPYATGQATGAH